MEFIMEMDNLTENDIGCLFGLYRSRQDKEKPFELLPVETVQQVASYIGKPVSYLFHVDMRQEEERKKSKRI